MHAGLNGFATPAVRILLVLGALVPPIAAAQPLAFYETRSVVLSTEQVQSLAGESYWRTRLAQQTQLTVVKGVGATDAELEPLFAAISEWLPIAPSGSSDWVFVLKDGTGAATALGGRAALRAGAQRPSLELQPFELDAVTAVEASTTAGEEWHPRRAFRHSGFPGGVEAYCETHGPICVAVAATGKGPARQLLTVRSAGSPTTVLLEREAGPPGSGPLVRYLGEAGVTLLPVPAAFSSKDAADFSFEQQSAEGLGALQGAEDLDRRERIAVKVAASSYFQSGTRSAEADVVLPVGPAGEEMLYTLRFLAQGNDITVEALGRAAELLPAAGPRSDVRRIPGFPATADRAGLLAWLRKRYPALVVTGGTHAEVVQSADRTIEKNSGTAEWFAANYAIQVLDPKAADQRLAQAHGRGANQRGGLRPFEAAELRALEAVLQRLGAPGLEVLKGTAVVRQRSTEEASPFGDLTTRVQISGHTFTRTHGSVDGEGRPRVEATVVIYDVAHAPRRFIGGLAPDGVVRVYPPVAEVIAHELAHVISQRAPVQRQFDALVASVGAAPFTRYAESNPQTEFFPEAFALYLLDPAWVKANHPELYARVRAYAGRPRAGAL
jgi:hypothetical protein